MEEKEIELTLKIYSYLQHKGFVGAFSEYMDNVYLPIRSFGKPESTVAKDLVEAIKIGVEATKKTESNGIDMKDIIEVFKVGLEAAKAHQPSGMDELFFNKEKMADIRKICGGTDTGATDDFALKKLELEQTERLENKKLDWEQKKWELEKEREANILESIGRIMGSVNTSKLKTSLSGFQPNCDVVLVKCPSCKGEFIANPKLPQIHCPLCNEQLQNGSQLELTPKKAETEEPKPST